MQNTHPAFSSELAYVLERAQAQGATAADAIAVTSKSLSHRQRAGKPELTEAAHGQSLGVRVFIGKQQTVLATNDLRHEVLDTMVDNAVSAAKLLPENPYCGLAESLPDPALMPPQLQLEDGTTMELPQLVELAARAEDTALAVAGISNSEGAEASYGHSTVHAANTNGLAYSYASTGFSIGLAVLAGEGEDMQNDYAEHSALHFEDLDAPELLGKRAAERALANMHPRKIPTQQAAVMFSDRVSASLLGHIAQALNGRAQVEKTSFLHDSLGRQLLPREIEVVEDPFQPRGLGSRPIDGEGIVGGRRKVIENGCITGYFLDLASARQLDMRSTGAASRAVGGIPSPRASNLYIPAGEKTEAELMKDIGTGLYVTGLMGMGVNIVNGDYSQGAQGFWIENGEIAYPVAEVTIAGKLAEMYAELCAASNLVFRRKFNAPSLLVARMTIGGA